MNIINHVTVLAKFVIDMEMKIFIIAIHVKVNIIQLCQKDHIIIVIQNNNGVYYLDDQNNYYCLDTNKCPEQYNKSVPEKGQCTDDCTKIDNYQYEFRKICYNECPIDITYNNNYYCEIKCNKSYPFEIVEKQICTNFCGINDMNKKLCKSKYKDEGTNENLILLNIRKDIISSNFNKD